MKWKVIALHDPSDESVLKEFDPLEKNGLKVFNCFDYNKIAAFLDWKETVNKPNAAVAAEKCNERSLARKSFLWV
jgi:hypothetical protein